MKQKTAKTRFARFLRNLGQWLWQHMHDPVREQHKAIGQKLRGHDGYYGVVGNSRALAQLRYWVERLWRWTLSRRSSAGRLPPRKLLELHETMGKLVPQIGHWLRTGFVASGKIINLHISLPGGNRKRAAPAAPWDG